MRNLLIIRWVFLAVVLKLSTEVTLKDDLSEEVVMADGQDEMSNNFLFERSHEEGEEEDHDHGSNHNHDDENEIDHENNEEGEEEDHDHGSNHNHDDENEIDHANHVSEELMGEFGEHGHGNGKKWYGCNDHNEEDGPAYYKPIKSAPLMGELVENGNGYKPTLYRPNNDDEDESQLDEGQYGSSHPSPDKHYRDKRFEDASREGNCRGGVCLEDEEVMEKVNYVRENIESFMRKGFKRAEDLLEKQNQGAMSRMTKPNPTSAALYRIKAMTVKGKMIEDCHGLGMHETSKLVAESLNLPREITALAFKNITIPAHLSSMTTKQCAHDKYRALQPELRTCPTGAAARFRTIDGSCNNENNPSWGKEGTPFVRMVPAIYEGTDGIRATGSSGNPLPNCRLVSTTMQDATPPPSSTVMTQMVKQMGQFLDHDMGHTPEEAAGIDSDGKPIGVKCCEEGVAAADDDSTGTGSCQCIDVSGDPYYSSNGRDSLRFVQSAVADSPSLSYREQVNLVTGFIDGSMIYGSEHSVAEHLRGEDGKLRHSENHENGRCILQDCSKMHFLPETGDNSNLFEAGDVRVNEQPVLTSMHTIGMRYHNLVATKLKKLHDAWDSDRLYFEARRIVGALIQHITYKEWLPMILSKKTMQDYGLETESSGYKNGYDKNMNPTHWNCFACAAFRFGHSLISNTIKAGTNKMTLCDFFFNNKILKVKGRQPSQLIEGDTKIPAEPIDLNFASCLTNHLFAVASNKPGNDLMALNCNRGRGHGLPGYTTFRKECGLSAINNWADLSGVIKNSGIVTKLKSLYVEPEDIDLITGGLAESPDSGSLVGPTFGCIIGSQFKKLKYGDRYFYEFDNGEDIRFTPAQLSAIRRTTFASMLCDVTAINRYSSDPMSVESDGSSSCFSHKKNSLLSRMDPADNIF